jgi:ubiquinone/menaquinone biosynthesis C-methylase UbiE
MISLKQQLTGAQLIGVEASIYAAKRAKKLTRDEIIVASAEALPFNQGTFDLVTALELVEHLADISKHLLETHRVLTDNGTYFASSTPNRIGVSRVLEVVGLLKSNPTHARLYTSGKLRKLLRTAGFRRLLIRPVQMGLPLPNGRFLPISFLFPFGSSLLACGQKQT